MVQSRKGQERNMAFCCVVVLVSAMATIILGAPIPLEMVDMTYVFDNTTLYWPTEQKFELTLLKNSTQKEGYWLQMEQYISGIHVGTHMDAPCHFLKGGWCVDDIPLSRFIAQASVIDVTQKAAKDRDYLVQVVDLENWEAASGQNLNETIVMVRSGWGQKWPDREAFTGNRNPNDTTKLHYPGVSKEAAQWLVNKRRIYGIGIDSLSLDNGPNIDRIAHKTLLGKNIFALENVANMEEMPIYGATLYVMPMKIGNASGAPVRIVATFPKVAIAKEAKTGTEQPFREVIIFKKN